LVIIHLKQLYNANMKVDSAGSGLIKQIENNIIARLFIKTASIEQASRR
jgi:hypothetical protein